jgi:S-formylglutathione hydrolase FrmB
MSLAHLHYYSNAIGKQVQAEVLLPDTGKGPFPVLYLLHGLSDDHTIWLRRTRLEMYVWGKPLIVVMPDGFRGFYTDHDKGPKFGTHLGEELVDTIDRFFPTIRKRSGRAIGGLSMGGYGALRTALAYPDRFCSAHSHSGALLHGSKPWPNANDRLDSEELIRVFGRTPMGTAHDVVHLAQTAMKAKKLPAMLVDCGTEDFLLEDNRTFHAKLKSLRVPHTYKEYPGSHNWDYWDEHIREALAFHGKNLGIG